MTALVKSTFAFLCINWLNAVKINNDYFIVLSAHCKSKIALKCTKIEKHKINTSKH